MKTAAIILAAGNSSRLGRPKQNLVFEGETLLNRVVQTVKSLGLVEIVLVLGANKETILERLKAEEITLLTNESWQEGMSSSIQLGLKHLLSKGDLDNLLLLLSDQPFVTRDFLQGMMDKHLLSGKGITAAFYQNTVGVPAFFGQKYFPELLALKGSEGAKKTLLRHQDDLGTFEFPEGSIDIDTEEDYRNLLGL